jgi:hypothetical protein
VVAFNIISGLIMLIHDTAGRPILETQRSARMNYTPTFRSLIRTWLMRSRDKVRPPRQMQ